MGKRRLGKRFSQETKTKMSVAKLGKPLSGGHKRRLSEVRKGKMPKFVPPPMPGIDNPMFGRTAYSAWVERYGKDEADHREAQRRKNTSIHNTRPMKGRSVYGVWLTNYGKEEADRRMRALREKQRLNSSGTNNPMYGKPSPKGSGNGWSGWYGGYFFRSLLELSFMLEMDRQGKIWESGEQKKYAVVYGDGRNYFPDFYIPAEQLFIEVKPSRLLNSQQNPDKFAAARTVFPRFEVITEKDLVKIEPSKLIALCAAGTVKLTDRWKAKLPQSITGADVQ